MRVRAVEVEWDNLELGVVPFVSKSQTYVTPGAEYDVHAISVYKKVVFLLLVDDLNTPVFIPSALFNVVCMDTPSDWKCNLIGKSGVDLVLGPDFVAEDICAYNRTIDQDSEQIAKLWNRISQIQNAPDAQ